MMIKLVRGFIIFTSICCMILYLYTGEMESVRNNELLGYLFYYTLATSIFLYPISAIMFIRDIYKALRTKSLNYIWVLSIDVALPVIAVILYNEFFMLIRT